MTSPHILVMSESPANARRLWGLLTERPCYAEVANSEAAALLRVRRSPPPDLVILDLNCGNNPLRTLETLRSLCPEINVVVVSAHDDTRQIVEAIRLGARDYLTIPVGGAELEQIIRRHAQSSSPRTLALVREPVEDLEDGQFFVAASAVMQKVRVQAERVANIDAPVLILGESWTGKEAVARLIHKLSSRSAERFLTVNCGALSGELLDGELFGYEAATFAGALHSKPGKFELCDKGTILISEVAELPAGLQAKLLCVLQDRKFSRLGGEHTKQADVRILAATNTNIHAALADGKFSEDLYYRLGAFVIQLPPLREHREDIPILLRHFMARLATQYSRPPVAFSASTLDACLRYSWPGNLRELENFVKRYLVMGEEAIAHGELRSGNGRRQVAVTGLAIQERPRVPRTDEQLANDEAPTCHLKSMVRDLKDEAEIRAIRQALRETRWNRKRAARLLDISYRGLLYKIRQHDITREPDLGSWASVRDRHQTNRNDDDLTSIFGRNNEKP
jgi:two-component system, NtrC family, response regulator AtoC